MLSLYLYCLEYYRQNPPKVPHFLKTLFRRKLVIWFLASELLRDYWLSGVSFNVCFHTSFIKILYDSHMDATGVTSGK